MGLNNTAKNLMLDALGAVVGYISMHTASPGSNGANEVTGGSPAYARQAVTWNSASGGDLDNNANPVFDIPAGTTITHYGMWSAPTGGTFYGGDPLSASESYGAQGTYTLTDLDVTLS